MMSQLSIEEAIAAVQQVGDNANPDWKKKAMQIVRELCEARREFTTDDVWGELTKYGYVTHEPRALGSLMLKSVRNGICENTGRYVHSQRKACHSRPIPVYSSLIFSARWSSGSSLRS